MNKQVADIGVIGMAVMGKNLAMNIADHGFATAVYNRTTEVMEAAVSESEGRLIGFAKLEDFVAALRPPRKILLMVKAGKAVDAVIASLTELISPGDILIDGGNSWFEDTQRREKQMRESGFHFFGVGVSGGEEGARHGPSLMPGGSAEGYSEIRSILEAIAAKTDSGPCVTHVGSDGAGHFVKMVHNGIEYADMQFIAESYDLLKRLLGLSPPEIAEVFTKWNKGPLESFLVEITAEIFKVRDNRSDDYLIDQVLDRAGQKGTGRWTAQIALELGVPIPSIAAAIDARVLSSMKADRLLAEGVLSGPLIKPVSDQNAWLDAIHDALYGAKIGAYAQGMSLIAAASDQYGWNIELKEMARIWKGGCIIRARFLDTIMKAYETQPALRNLLLDTVVSKTIQSVQNAWRKVAKAAIEAGIAIPAISAGLAYFDSIRTGRLPQNLTQAQRDAFGAHTYQRSDDPDGPFIHTDWLGSVGDKNQ